MDPFQRAHESAVALRFVAWYNKRHRTQLTFGGRVGLGDWVFQDGDRSVRAQISSVNYDTLETRFKWRGAISAPDSPPIWSATEFLSARGLHQCGAGRQVWRG